MSCVTTSSGEPVKVEWTSRFTTVALWGLHGPSLVLRETREGERKAWIAFSTHRVRVPYRWAKRRIGALA